MDRDTFQTWISTLGHAWVTKNPQAAAELFTDDATYQENLFDTPLHGRPAIYRYWADAVRAHEQVHFTHEILAVTPEAGVARWHVSLVRVPSGQQAELDGVLVAYFHDGEHRSHALREWWTDTIEPSNRPAALITGASRGLGATLAGFLAGQGYDLILTARGPEALVQVAEQARRFDTRAIALPGDVADPVHRLFLGEAIRALGRLDLLLNNASTLGPTPLLTLDRYPLDALREVYDVNVIAPVGLAQVALPFLKANGGLIVNISSDAALGGYETWGGYGSSKAALDLISLTMANELRGEGVSVVSVDPGDMRTTMNQEANPGADISHLPTPDVTLPFWAWLLGQDHRAVSGQRFQAQGERWEVASL